MSQFDEDVRFGGLVRIAEGNLSAQPRTFLKQDDNQVFGVPWHAWRQWDHRAVNLPETPASDDLGLVTGTFGTDTPTIQTGDVKNVGCTRRAGITLEVPAEYVAGQSFTLRFCAGLLTTLSSGAATLDVEVFRTNRQGVVTGADLYTGAALDIKSLTLTDKDFPLTVSALSPGDLLDVRITITIVDSATATDVIGIVACVERIVDIKG